MSIALTVRKSVGGPPRLLDLPATHMAVVRTIGGDDVVRHALEVLYRRVYDLKFELSTRGVAFRVGHLRVRWPGPDTTPGEGRVALWGLPVPLADLPAGTVELPAGDDVRVGLETWEYGTAVQVRCASADAPAALAHLREFLRQGGYEMTGSPEQEHLSGPGARQQRVLVRLPVQAPPASAAATVLA